MLEEGKPFPAFDLPDQDGNSVSLESLKGQTTVLYFYPKDDTTGCTAEACEFRDEIPRLKGVRVIGVSPDGAKSHRKFIAKYNLNFTLLSDEEHKLLEPLGLWIEKSMYGKTYLGVDRTTVVLDADGVVKKAFRKVKPQGHAKEVQAFLDGAS